METSVVYDADEDGARVIKIIIMMMIVVSFGWTAAHHLAHAAQAEPLMGHKIVCGTCGSEVYTTGDRMPEHQEPGGMPGTFCRERHAGSDPNDYVIGFDGDFSVYQGGAWEMGKNA